MTRFGAVACGNQCRGRVFEFGIRFVRQIEGAHEQKVVEGALKHEVEAGFVTVEEVEAGVCGDLGVGGGEAVEVVTGVFDALVVEEAGLDGPGAAHAPAGGDHFLDEAQLDAVGGRKAADVLAEERFEVLRRFAFHEHDAGEKAVAERVHRRAPLAFGRDGAFRFSTVRLRGENAS